MRVKLVPAAPDTLETVDRARAAVPLVPGGAADCCSRIMDRIDIPARDEARVWLTFLRGLELVAEGPGGFVRTREEVDLASAFRAGVYGADEVIGILEANPGPMTVDDVLAAFTIPAWERHRHQDPETVWRERLGDLLDWLVLLGEARRSNGGYVRD